MGLLRCQWVGPARPRSGSACDTQKRGNAGAGLTLVSAWPPCHKEGLPVLQQHLQLVNRLEAWRRENWAWEGRVRAAQGWASYTRFNTLPWARKSDTGLLESHCRSWGFPWRRFLQLPWMQDCHFATLPPTRARQLRTGLPDSQIENKKVKKNCY